MERYLYFDSACPVCTDMARKIQVEANGWLVAKPLRDEEAQKVLDQTRPGWQWEPTLLIKDESKSQVYTGGALAAQLVLGLGIKRSWRILQMVRDVALLPAELNRGRRGFLKLGGSLAAGLVIMPGLLTPKTRPQLETTQAEPLVMPDVLEGTEAQAYLQKALASPDLALIKSQIGIIDEERVVVQRHRQGDENTKHTVYLPISDVGYVIYSITENTQSEKASDTRALYYAYDLNREVTGPTTGGIDRWANLAAGSINGRLVERTSTGTYAPTSSSMMCSPVDRSSCDTCPTYGIQYVQRECCKTTICCTDDGQPYDVYCCCLIISRGPCEQFC